MDSFFDRLLSLRVHDALRAVLVVRDHGVVPAGVVSLSVRLAAGLCCGLALLENESIGVERVSVRSFASRAERSAADRHR